MTTRSTPASSIIGSARSMVNGSGNCGVTPGSQGQSGELAFQKCTWASTIVRLLAGCGRACCAPVASAAPATSAVPMNLRRVSMVVLPDGATLWQRFVVGILQPEHGKAQCRSSPLGPRRRNVALGSKADIGGSPGPCPVCTENSDSNILMMQPADQGVRNDATAPLNGTPEWRILVQ